MEPIYTYTEQGSKAPRIKFIFWGFLVLILGVSTPWIFKEPLPYLVIGIIIRVLLVLYIFIMITKPRLELIAWPDRIEIHKYFGKFYLQGFEIETNRIRKINKEQEDLNNLCNLYRLSELIVDQSQEVNLPAIIYVSQFEKAPYLSIETIDKIYILVLKEAASVIEQLKSIYGDKEPDINELAESGKPLIEYKRGIAGGNIILQPEVNIFEYLGIYFIILFGNPPLCGQYTLNHIDVVLLYTLAIGAGLIAVIAPFKMDNILERFSVFNDRIESVRGLWGRKKRVFYKNEIKSISTAMVKFGDYSNYPEWENISGFGKKAGSHKVVLIEVEGKKYAFGLPFPDQTAATLRELYGLNSGN
ncbi:MAG: hypothetical protein NTY09_03420 [bacterium]|nr:hypothetical protein [bacterium]